MIADEDDFWIYGYLYGRLCQYCIFVYQRDDALYNAPQLVTMGATLRNRLKGYLLVDSGWFTKQSGNLVRITETLRPTTLRK